MLGGAANSIWYVWVNMFVSLPQCLKLSLWWGSSAPSTKRPTVLHFIRTADTSQSTILTLQSHYSLLQQSNLKLIFSQRLSYSKIIQLNLPFPLGAKSWNSKCLNLKAHIHKLELWCICLYIQTFRYMHGIFHLHTIGDVELQTVKLFMNII